MSIFFVHYNVLQTKKSTPSNKSRPHKPKHPQRASNIHNQTPIYTRNGAHLKKAKIYPPINWRQLYLNTPKRCTKNWCTKGLIINVSFCKLIKEPLRLFYHLLVSLFQFFHSKHKTSFYISFLVLIIIPICFLQQFTKYF